MTGLGTSTSRARATTRPSPASRLSSSLAAPPAPPPSAVPSTPPIPPIPAPQELSFLTPLEAARTPTLDALATAGVVGLQDTAEPGLACGSDTAHLALLGYDPRVWYRGRGAFEAMGAGIDMRPGDVAFKANFGLLAPRPGPPRPTAGAGGRSESADAPVVLRRRADRDFAFDGAGQSLCDHLDGIVLPSFPEHAVTVRYATEHRCTVCVRAAGPTSMSTSADGRSTDGRPARVSALSAAVGGTDPLRDLLPLRTPRALDATCAEATRTAAVIAELDVALRAALARHPINTDRAARGEGPRTDVVLLRGPGVRLDAPTLSERTGLADPAIVAPTRCVAGIGISCGLRALLADGATGDARTRLAAKARAAADRLTGADGDGPPSDLVFLHVKAVDDAGHDRDPSMRVRWLERVDRMTCQLLLRLEAGDRGGSDEGADKGDNFAVLLGGDHSTPVAFGDHSHEPVPLVACPSVADALRAMAATSDGRARLAEERAVLTVAKAEAEVASIPHDGDPGGDAPVHAVCPDTGRVLRAPGGAFTEASCASGALGRFLGSEVIGLVRQLAGLSGDEDEE